MRFAFAVNVLCCLCVSCCVFFGLRLRCVIEVCDCLLLVMLLVFVGACLRCGCFYFLLLFVFEVCD